MRIEDLEDPLRRRDRLLHIGIDAAELPDRTIAEKEYRQECGEIPWGHLARRDLAARVPQQPRRQQAAEELHQRREGRQRARHFHIGAKQAVRRGGELAPLVPLRTERLDDAVSGERFGADMREHFQLLLAAPGRSPHALADPQERIHDQRCPGEAHQGQPRIIVEEQPRIDEDRQRFPQQIPNRLRHDVLHAVDVVGQPRHQLAGRAAAEEASRLVKHVAEQLVADVAHEPLADIGHQVHRGVRAEPLEQVARDEHRRHEPQPLARWQHVIDDRLDEHRQPA